MNLSKFLKGNVSISELEKMPNRYVQVIYKEYDTFMRDPEKKKAMEGEIVKDEIEEATGG